jgi:hypothetical protein
MLRRGFSESDVSEIMDVPMDVVRAVKARLTLT